MINRLHQLYSNLMRFYSRTLNSIQCSERIHLQIEKANQFGLMRIIALIKLVVLVYAIRLTVIMEMVAITRQSSVQLTVIHAVNLRGHSKIS